jgi:hypothetical protein
VVLPAHSRGVVICHFWARAADFIKNQTYESGVETTAIRAVSCVLLDWSDFLILMWKQPCPIAMLSEPDDVLGAGDCNVFRF